MYKKLKLVIRKLIPDRILFRFEPFLRRLLCPFYRGKTYQCTVCKKRLRKFIELNDGDKLCPYCGSISRNRRLWQILNDEFLKEGIRVLDFSPSRCLYRKLKKYPGIHYTSSDISGDFISDVSFDITQISTEDNSFDLIICYHILEHVENDKQAMLELYRVMKEHGTCLVQTPFKEGEIYEDPSVTTPQERVKHFGQEDHVRIYSVNGLKKRLENAGFRVEKREFTGENNPRYGFNNHEILFVCIKNPKRKVK